MKATIAACVALLVVVAQQTSAMTEGDGTPTPVPTPINVDDMMASVQQQTVFVTTDNEIIAITLLNHFTRYRIATNGVGRLSASPTGQWLYVLDEESATTNRLRVFDSASGDQRGVIGGLADVVRDPHALVTGDDGRTLLLRRDAEHAWVEAYAELTLRSLGVVLDKVGCGDRLLIGGGRAAILCLDSGEVALGNLRGRTDAVDGALPNVIAAAMDIDGRLLVVDAAQHLAIVQRATQRLDSVEWPADWSGTVVLDGLAISSNGTVGAIVQQTEDGAWARVFETDAMSGEGRGRASFRLAGLPRGSIALLWPFAYYTIGGTVRHVDLSSGLLEVMTDVGADAVPGAVVSR